MIKQASVLTGMVLLLAITALIIPLEVYSQVRDDIKFSHLTVDDGLSHHEVSFVLQDSQGFMWFGTKYGLNKYDGSEITVFNHDPENTNSLNGDFVWWIQEAKDGALWIPTWGNGISRLDTKTGKFTNYRHDVNDPQSLGGDLVWSVLEDSKGRIWAAPDSGGLNKFNPETNTWSRYRHDPNDPKSISHNSVSVISEDDQGMLWVATYGGGLNKFDPEKGTFTRYQNDKDNPDSLSNDNLWYVYIDSHSQIWIGSEKGLNKFNPNTEKFTRYQHDESNPNSLSFNTVTSIHEDKNGTLWVGTFGGGLNLFDPESDFFVHYKHDPLNPYSLLNNTVTSIYEDSTGTFWVSSYGGVDKYDPGGFRFEHYYKVAENSASLNSNSVRSIYQEENGTIWIGTEGGGLNRFDKTKNFFTHFTHDSNDPASISSNDILAIRADRENNLWIGTNGSGLNKFDYAEGKLTHYRHDPLNSNSLGSDTIYDVVVDPRKNILWIAAYTAGLDKYDIAQNKFIHYSSDESNQNSLSSNWVTTLLADSRGNVWIGGEPGLSQFHIETEKFTNYEHDPKRPESVSSNLVYTLHEDSRGFIWVGTNQGLNRYDASSNTFVRYYENDGLAGNRVVAIEEDDQGNLWISTDKGLSRFDSSTNTFRNYDQRDGLQGNRFQVNASHKNTAGELFFGGTNGFNIFHPSALSDNPHIPPIVFTDFNLLNLPVSVGEESPLRQHINHAQLISLDHDHSVFSIKFAALHYRNPGKSQYAYKMEGFDKEFTYIDSDDRSVTYTNLDPGRYFFHVKASNNDGIWNEEGRSIEIIINPPWWQTIWFKTLVIIILIILIVCVIRHVIKLRFEVRQRISAQNKLKKSEEKFRALIESSSDWIWEVNREGIYTYVSPQIEAILGYRPDEIIGKTPFDLMLPEEAEKSAKIFQDAAVSGRPIVTLENINLHRNGNIVVLETSGVPVLHTTGEVIGFRGVDRDITERKNAEEKLKKSERKYKDLQDESIDGYAWTDMEGHLIEVNNSYKNMMGYTEDELRELNYNDITPPKWHEFEEKILTEQILARGYSDIYEKELIRKDGKIFPVELRAYLIRDDKGNNTGMRAIVKDITARKQAENVLRENEEKYRLIFDNSPLGIVHFDKNGTVTACNDKVSQITGATIGFNALKSIKDAKMLASLTTALSGGMGHYMGDYQSVTEDIITPIRANLGPLFSNDGFVVGAIGILEDITKQKENEKEKEQLKDKLRQAQKMEAIGTLAGGIAHDFNNILSAILGYSEIAKDSLPPQSPIISDLNEVSRAGFRAKELVKQILTFSRQSEQELRPIQIHLIVKEALRLLRSSIPASIKIRKDIDPKGGIVFSDPTQIHQIIMNLCTNAYQAMRETGGELSITMRSIQIEAKDPKIKNSSLTSGPYVKLTVSDSGVGMDKQTLERIFDPYFTTKKQGEGTGLGLSVVHGIVKGLNGHISVHSNPGEGATFRVYLPRIISKKASEEIKQDEKLSTGNERVLIVDDEEAIMIMLKRTLTSLGYTVIGMSSSIIALQTFQENPDQFDLIITDMTMPDINGVELIQRIREIKPDKPIILCTGFSELIDPQKASILGVQKYLMKPVVKKELADAVREVLDGSK